MYSSLFLLFAITNVFSAASIHLEQKEAEEDQLPPVVFRLPRELTGDEIDSEIKDLNKRDAGDNVVEFALRINPVIPRNPMSLKNFSELNCVGKKNWCVEEPTTPIPLCPLADTPTPRTPTCGPSKPFITVPRRFRSTMCNFHRSDFPEPVDPCDECQTPPPCSSTPFVACQSVPPPTKPEKFIYCSPTMVAMHPPCTYMTPGEPTTKPLPVCNKAPPAVVKGQKMSAADDQYYILVKRSPKGRNRRRRKREYRPVVFLSRGQPRRDACEFQLIQDG